MRIALASALLAMSLTTGADAQPADDDEIVVTAERFHEQLRAFVGEVSAPPARIDQLSRWNHRVCPGVIGLRSRYAQAMADRIAVRAYEVGLRVEGPGCRANIIVFVTPESDQLARELVQDYRELFGSTQSENINTPGRMALAHFVDAPRPVRWWHVSNTVSREGHVLRDIPTGRDIRDNFVAPVIYTPSIGYGRLQATTRQDLDRTVIVVDARRTAGVNLDALSDYIAMIGLAQLDPDADTSSFDTILNLFAEREAGAAQPGAMTAWDAAYLQGLYHAPRNAYAARQQERAIVRRMEDEVPLPPAR
ncbi:hypothetical protein [Terricaulis sp.]|uniref:hypothetical protein n=1 Tax=Terricaulis sp. TaxID=2768686 RepID=UPI0037841ED3